MPICNKCKEELIKGKNICNFCGQDLYKGILIDFEKREQQQPSKKEVSKETSKEISWVKISTLNDATDANVILNQLAFHNIPAVKRMEDNPFEEVEDYYLGAVDIFVPEPYSKEAIEITG